MTSVPPLNPNDVTGFTIVRVHHLLARRFHETLATLDLTPPQFGVLTSLAHDAHTSQSSLARTSLVTPQTMGEILHGLEARGLITRPVGSKGHRRAVTLTDAGRALLDQATPLIAELDRPGALGLTSHQAQQLRGLLHTMLDHLT